MYSNLEGELRKRNITRQKMAEDLHLNISTISRKLTEAGRLKLIEAYKIRDLYFPKIDNLKVGNTTNYNDMKSIVNNVSHLTPEQVDDMFGGVLGK